MPRRRCCMRLRDGSTRSSPAAQKEKTSFRSKKARLLTPSCSSASQLYLHASSVVPGSVTLAGARSLVAQVEGQGSQARQARYKRERPLSGWQHMSRSYHVVFKSRSPQRFELVSGESREGVGPGTYSPLPGPGQPFLQPWLIEPTRKGSQFASKSDRNKNAQSNIAGVQLWQGQYAGTRHFVKAPGSSGSKWLEGERKPPFFHVPFRRREPPRSTPACPPRHLHDAERDCSSSRRSLSTRVGRAEGTLRWP